METELSDLIAKIHLDALIEKEIEITLNANQVLALVDLLEVSLVALPLHNLASEGFAELSEILLDLVLEVYPQIEPYLDKFSVLESSAIARGENLIGDFHAQ